MNKNPYQDVIEVMWSNLVKNKYKYQPGLGIRVGGPIGLRNLEQIVI